MEQLLQQLTNGVLLGSSYAVVALGFGLVYGVMRVVNVSHPEVVMVGAYGASVVSLRISSNPFLVVGASVLLAVVVGLIIERIAIRPTRGRYILIPFVATIGLSIVLQNGAQRIFGPDPVRLQTSITGVQHVGGVIASNMQLVTFGVAVAMLLAVRYYVRSTKWGRATRAVAEKHEVAAALGVDINRVSEITVGIAAALAGAAGATIALTQGQAAPFLGVVYGLKSFIIVLVAGNRHIEGIVAVGILLGVVETLIAGYLSTSLRDVASFTILVAVLYLKPTGLFGSYERER